MTQETTHHCQSCRKDTTWRKTDGNIWRCAGCNNATTMIKA